MYRSAADKDTSAARRKTSLAKAEKLEARAPRLHFTIRPSPPGLVLRVDGAEVARRRGRARRHRPARGRRDRARLRGTRVRAGQSRGHDDPVIVQLNPTRRGPAPSPRPARLRSPRLHRRRARAPAQPLRRTRPSVEPPRCATDGRARRADHRKRNGIILGAAGLGVLAGAVIAYEAGSNKFDDAGEAVPGPDVRERRRSREGPLALLRRPHAARRLDRHGHRRRGPDRRRRLPRDDRPPRGGARRGPRRPHQRGRRYTARF